MFDYSKHFKPSLIFSKEDQANPSGAPSLSRVGFATFQSEIRLVWNSYPVSNVLAYYGLHVKYYPAEVSKHVSTQGAIDIGET